MTTRKKARSCCLINKNLKLKGKDAHRNLLNYQRKKITTEKQLTFKMSPSDPQLKQIKN